MTPSETDLSAPEAEIAGLTNAAIDLDARAALAVVRDINSAVLTAAVAKLVLCAWRDGLHHGLMPGPKPAGRRT